MENYYKTLRNKTFYILLVCLITNNLSFAQSTFTDIKELPVKLDKKLQKGDVIIGSSKLSTNTTDFRETFQLDVQVGGTFYLNVLVLGSNGEKGLNSTEIFIDNNNVPSGILSINKTGWQEAFLTTKKDKNVNQPLVLSQGKHTITFQTKVPETPVIDLIQFNRTDIKGKGQTSEGTLKALTYIENLKKAPILESNYEELKKAGKIDDTGSSKRSNSNQRVIDNPLGEYEHSIEERFTYTTSFNFYLEKNQTYKFETWLTNGDPVMYVYNYDNVAWGSWSDDDSGEGVESFLQIKIPRTGLYTILIRSYGSNSLTTTQFWRNDQVYASDLPVGGAVFPCESKGGNLNFFTAKTPNYGSPKIYVAATMTAPIKAQNYGYEGASDFSWGSECRVKSNGITRMFVSNPNLNRPEGITDVYMNVQFSNANQTFQNLKADDALRSASESYYYNCIAWAGGMYNEWIWPDNALSPWWGNDMLSSFDNYFANRKRVRYAGAYNFTRTDATFENASVDLWYNNYTGYTHASVTKPGNENPHGFDWESKPGSMMRTFHPRNSLLDEGPYGYGHVSNYYRWDGTKTGRLAVKYMTMEESIKEGFTVLDKVELTPNEKEKLTNINQALPFNVSLDLQALYDNWKKTWDNPEIAKHSNPRVYSNSNEYKKLIAFCKKNGKTVWPFLFERFEQGDFLAINPIEDLTFNENKHHVLAVRNEDISNQRLELPYVAPSLKANYMRYIKRLLGELGEPKNVVAQSGRNDSQITSLNQNTPNPFIGQTEISFNLSNKGNVSLIIYDMDGGELVKLLDNQNLISGLHKITWDGKAQNGNSIKSGIYIYKLISSDFVITKKLQLLK